MTKSQQRKIDDLNDLLYRLQNLKNPSTTLINQIRKAITDATSQTLAREQKQEQQTLQQIDTQDQSS